MMLYWNMEGNFNSVYCNAKRILRNAKCWVQDLHFCLEKYSLKIQLLFSAGCIREANCYEKGTVPSFV